MKKQEVLEERMNQTRRNRERRQPPCGKSPAARPQMFVERLYEGNREKASSPSEAE
jgi:hypothetical protein